MFTDECLEGKDAGPCTDFKTRYYYDKTDNLCKTFQYGGCQGNGNQFRSKQTCRDTCKVWTVYIPSCRIVKQWFFVKQNISICFRAVKIASSTTKDKSEKLEAQNFAWIRISMHVSFFVTVFVFWLEHLNVKFVFIIFILKLIWSYY